MHGATSGPTIRQNMNKASLWIWLVLTAVLACVWWKQLSKLDFAGLVYIRPIAMLAADPSHSHKKCSGSVAKATSSTQCNDIDRLLDEKVPRVPLVVIDLCAALLAPRLHLQVMLRVLTDNGVEIAIYSALDARTTRDALRLAGMLEWFDHIWHIDAIRQFEKHDLHTLAQLNILNTPGALRVKPLMAAGGVPPERVPAWLRWLV